VIATPRAAGFQAAWSGVGSTSKIVLYSGSGAAIPPGRGAVLHVCYAVKEGAPEGAYPLHFSRSLVATPGGKAIPFCPTFAVIEGRICVGEPPCDLNGDGVGDIRDIVLLVRCILGDAASSDACPDDVRARADCNGDGSVDVRDVVCCVRRILAHDGGWGPEPPAKDGSGGTPTRLGFDGGAEWMNPLEARVALILDPGDDFGGVQWVLDPGATARVRDLELEDPQSPYALDVSAQPDGSLRVMLYDRGSAGGGSASAARSAPAIPVRLVATLEPAPGVSGPATVSIRSVRGAAWDASPLPAVVLNAAASLPANPAAEVPMVLPARPSPFLSETEIAYSIPAGGAVSLRLFDVGGRLVRTLASGRAEAGVHRVRWDGHDDAGRTVGAGVYFVRFEAAGTARTYRLLRLR
jgi:hypothetical protein